MTDTLLAAFKRIMSMTDARTSLIQISCYGLGYFIFAFPAAIYIKRFSYKSGVLLGLGFYILGCLLFFPAKLTGNYFHFLGALWILFGGIIYSRDSRQSVHYCYGRLEDRYQEA